MRRRLIIAAVILGLVAVPLLQGLSRRQPVMVDVEAAAARELKPSVLASGVLEFRERADLSPEVLAKVSQIFVKEGERVKKGQLVLQLDSTGLTAEVEQRESAAQQQQISIRRHELNVAQLRKQFERVQQVHARRLVDDAALDDKKAELDKAAVDLDAARQALVQANAALRQARDSLSKTAITAPIDGTVTAIDIKVGETAVPSTVGVAGSKLMAVADTATIMAKVAVDEADIGRVALGQEVSVFPAAAADTALRGHIVTIPLSPTEPAPNSRVAARAKSYAVEVDFADAGAGAALRPGMTCRAEIVVSTAARVLAVPLQAVMSESDGAPLDRRAAKNTPESHYVFVVKDGEAVRRVVVAGESDDSHWEIKSGVAAGEEVVVGPYKVLRRLHAGDRIAAAAAGTPEA